MKTISLYIHYPYCVRKCNYCDFLSAPADEAAREHYVHLLCEEIRGRAAEATHAIESEDALDESVNGRARVDTLYFGGGTPSLMTEAQLGKIMEVVRASYDLMPNAEITLEVNPGTADYEKLAAFHRVGVNRLSIGAQSFIPSELQMLGRIHTAAQISEVFGAAREAGFDNLSLDLMSALPGQTMESWTYNLGEAVRLGPEHLSCYSLIIEEGTPFAKMSLPPLPSEEEDRAMYHFTGSFLQSNGYARYEISNYAKTGYESRHNLGYWTGHEYLGIGLGASSCLQGERFHNPQEMETYEHAVQAMMNSSDRREVLSDAGTEMPVENPNKSTDVMRMEVQKLSREDRMEEFMFLGLRCTRGVSETAFQEEFGVEIDTVYGDVICRHLAQDVLRREDGRLFLSEYGLDVASYVMADYLMG